MLRYIFTIITLIGLLTIESSCSGGSSRHRGDYENNDDYEEHANRRNFFGNMKGNLGSGYSDHSDSYSSRANSYSGYSKSIEYFQHLAAGDDYDAMLDALGAIIGDFERLSDRYLAGNMTDKEVGTALQEICARYAPIIDRLSEASSAGELTYRQHEKQIELFIEFQEFVNSLLERVGIDVESEEFSRIFD